MRNEGNLKSFQHALVRTKASGQPESNRSPNKHVQNTKELYCDMMPSLFISKRRVTDGTKIGKGSSNDLFHSHFGHFSLNSDHNSLPEIIILILKRHLLRQFFFFSFRATILWFRRWRV
jgi:hypothetical protein